MMDYSFEAEGLKVRATEPESMGSLIELDLRGLQVTSDGTYLVTSKALQSVGDWAFGVDGLQAEKAGKPAPDRAKAPKPSETLHIMNSLLAQVPGLIAQIKSLKAVDPIEKGVTAATAEVVCELTKELIEQIPEIRERLKDIARQSIEHCMGSEDEEQE